MNLSGATFPFIDFLLLTPFFSSILIECNLRSVQLYSTPVLFWLTPHT